MQLYKHDTEQHIVQLFGRGDASAMSRLYAEYARYLTGVCARYIPDADDRKDVLQEAFIQIYTQMPTFVYRGRGSLRAWVTRIVVNQALMFIRRHAQLATVEADATLPDVPEEEPAIDELSEDDILTLIQQLPAGYRMVFNLYAIEGKTHGEIAQLLGIRPDSSASQYARARRLLAKMINDYRLKTKR